MRALRLAATCFAALAVTGSVQARPDAVQPAAPKDLRAFLLRPTEPRTHEFARTPSFSWLPVRGAVRYEFELSKNPRFDESGIFWSDATLKSPAVAVPVALPWMTGSPYAVYARVRAITPKGVSGWSASFGFNVRWGGTPQPLPTYPGMSRWSVVDGATGYQVWFPSIRKIVGTRTNAVDHREFYAFHQQQAFSGTVNWRVRAVRSLYGKIPSGLPTVSYGPWSATYTTTNPALADGVVTPSVAVADDTVTSGAAPALHQLTPGFAFTGTRAGGGTPSGLYRVYVFSDADCVNVIHRGSIVGSPAYVPRTTGSLKLPLTATEATIAATTYLKDLTDGQTGPPQFMFDSAKVTSTESDPPPAAQAATPPAGGGASSGSGSGSGSGTPAEGDPASTPPANDPSLPATPKSSGAPVDLWDSGWPNGRFYWTAVPVRFETADPKVTALTAATAPGASAFRVANANDFAVPQLIRIGSGATEELLTISAVNPLTSTLSTQTAATYAHNAGETVANLTSTLDYWDLELPQDACAAGRVQAFGKGSPPVVAGGSSPFVAGLSPTGRLTSATRATPAFYGSPLVAWAPALGADQYQVQWSKTRYPWKTGGERFTYATSALLQLQPGRWWYRVRGVNFSLPGTGRAMAWSEPVGLRVTKPTFTVVGKKQAGRRK